MNNLEFRRIRIGVLRVTQKDLSLVLGVSPDTISRIERGAYKICNRTRFSMLYLEEKGVLPVKASVKPARANKPKNKRKKR